MSAAIDVVQLETSDQAFAASSCASRVTYFVLSQLKHTSPSLGELDSIYGVTHQSRSVSMLKLKNHFDGNGLHTLPVAGALEDIAGRYPDCLSILHTSSPAGSAEEHFVVLAREGHVYQIVDAPQVRTMRVSPAFEKTALQNLAGAIGFQGTALVVSSRPLKAPVNYGWPVAFGSASLLVLAALLLRLIAKRFRSVFLLKKRRLEP